MKKCKNCNTDLYKHEDDLLDGLCPKCYDNLNKYDYYNSSGEIIREYYRNEFEREINK